MAELTRRRLGLSAIAASLAMSLSRVPRSEAARESSPSPVLPPGRMLTGTFQALSLYDATVVDEVTALLIPRDQDGGAREAGVVTKLDAQLVPAAEKREIYRLGVAWLDWLTAVRTDSESFLLAPLEDRMAILSAAEQGRLSRIEQLKEWWHFGARGHGARFFEVVRVDTFMAFYVSRDGWRVAGYQGPPQFGGYPHYPVCT